MCTTLRNIRNGSGRGNGVKIWNIARILSYHFNTKFSTFCTFRIMVSWPWFSCKSTICFSMSSVCNDILCLLLSTFNVWYCYQCMQLSEIAPFKLQLFSVKHHWSMSRDFSNTSHKNMLFDSVELMLLWFVDTLFQNWQVYE